VRISPKVRRRPADVVNQELFWKYEDVPIALPRRFLPDTSFLKYHNDKVFVSR